MNYVKSAATAKRLIEANGRSVFLIFKDEQPSNAAKPWRGPGVGSDIRVGPIKAVVYPNIERGSNGELINRGGETIVVAHDSLSPTQDLQNIDAIDDGDVIYKVDTANKIGPGDTVICYEFGVKR